MLRTNSLAQDSLTAYQGRTYGVKKSQLRDRYHSTRSSFSICFIFNLYLYELQSRWQHTGTVKENAEMNNTVEEEEVEDDDDDYCSVDAVVLFRWLQG